MVGEKPDETAQYGASNGKSAAFPWFFRHKKSVEAWAENAAAPIGNPKFLDSFRHAESHGSSKSQI